MIVLVRNFYEKYKKYLILSICLHLVFFILLSCGDWSQKVEVAVVAESNSTENTIKTTTINTEQVDKLIKNIKQEERNKVASSKREQRELAKLKKEKIAHEKLLKQLKAQKAELRKESEKLKETSLQAKQDIEKKQQQLQELSIKAQKAAEEEKKKIEAEKRTLVVNEYGAKIVNAIYKEFIIKPEYIEKNLSSKVEIMLAKNGVVMNVRVIKTSGDAVYDRVAVMAVKKASPLPVPEDQNIFSNEFKVFTLNLNPQELQR